MTTKDKLQSQCCVFHAIADKAKYLSSILSHWTISAAAVGPEVDSIEGNAPQTGVFIHFYNNNLKKKPKGCVSNRTAAVMSCSDQI